MIVFKCKNCCGKELEAFTKLRVTCWILLKRRLGMNRDMVKKICQFIIKPIHVFEEEHISVDGFSRHGSCARIYTSMDDDGYLNRYQERLKGVTSVEVDIAPLTSVSFGTLKTLLKVFDFESVVARWELVLIDIAMLKAYFWFMKECAVLYIIVQDFGLGSQELCLIHGSKMIRVTNEKKTFNWWGFSVCSYG
jgi:hypothetical protein